MSFYELKLIGLFVVVVFIAEIFATLTAFKLTLLPEFALAITLVYMLAVLAIKLDEGYNKKVLAVETLDALCVGIGYTLILYFYNFLNYEGPDIIFNGYLHSNMSVIMLKIVLTSVGWFVLANSRYYLSETPHDLLEYPIVLTLALLFMLFLIGAGHLVSAFISIVGFSLNSYVLILFGAPYAAARESSIKYFYLSALSSGLMLYGIFLLYFTIGTCQFHEMNQVLSTNIELVNMGGTVLQYGILFFLIGLSFKLSAFPGHLWAPEVYEGSPDTITAFFMLPVKVSVLAFLIQFLAIGLPVAAVLWQPIIALSAVGSLVWGCFGAFVEKKTKRFLAYASINQMGFLLLGLAAGSFEGYRSTLFYLLIYVIMNVGFLAAFLRLRRSPDHGCLGHITDFTNLGWVDWFLAWSLTIILLSMAGIPPLAGFFGKYFLLLHVQEQGLYGLVIVSLITSLISAYYYLRIIKIFWFESWDNIRFNFLGNFELTDEQRITVTFSEAAVWLLSIFSTQVISDIDTVVEELLLASGSASFFFFVKAIAVVKKKKKEKVRRVVGGAYTNWDLQRILDFIDLTLIMAAVITIIITLESMDRR